MEKCYGDGTSCLLNIQHFALLLSIECEIANTQVGANNQMMQSVHNFRTKRNVENVLLSIKYSKVSSFPGNDLMQGIFMYFRSVFLPNTVSLLMYIVISVTKP